MDWSLINRITLALPDQYLFHPQRPPDTNFQSSLHALLRAVDQREAGPLGITQGDQAGGTRRCAIYQQDDHPAAADFARRMLAGAVGRVGKGFL